MRRTTLLLVCAAAACTLVVTGCTNDQDPPPASAPSEGLVTPKPLPTIPSDPQRDHELAAIAAWENYISAINVYYQNGDYSVEAQTVLGIGSMQYNSAEWPLPTDQSVAEFAQMLQGGAHQEGDIVTRSEKVIQYIPGGNPDYGATNERVTAAAAAAGFDRAVLEVCYDPSGALYVNPDGSQVAAGRSGHVITVTMDTQPMSDGSDGWAIRYLSSDLGRPCS